MKPGEFVTKPRRVRARAGCRVQAMLAFHNRMYEIGQLQEAARDKGKRSSLAEPSH